MTNKQSKGKLVSVLLLLVMLVLIAVLAVDLVPVLLQVYKDRGDESQMASYVSAHGGKGVLLIIGLQALQVIVAIIPAAAVQLLAGLCYGVWGGAGLCLIGYVLGNVAVFVALRQFGRVLGPLVPQRAVAKKKKGRFDMERLAKMQKPWRTAFLLYLIPGVPNGVLPYLFAGSSITFWQYLASVVGAGAPSVVLCTWIGERLSKGDWRSALLIAAVILLATGAIFLLKDRLFQKIDRGAP